MDMSGSLWIDEFESFGFSCRVGLKLLTKGSIMLKQADVASGTFCRSWQKVESANGKVFYVDPDTGDISHERPADFQETKPVSEMVESKTAKGVYYYHNHDSGVAAR